MDIEWRTDLIQVTIIEILSIEYHYIDNIGDFGMTQIKCIDSNNNTLLRTIPSLFNIKLGDTIRVPPDIKDADPTQIPTLNKLPA